MKTLAKLRGELTEMEMQVLGAWMGRSAARLDLFEISMRLGDSRYGYLLHVLDRLADCLPTSTQFVVMDGDRWELTCHGRDVVEAG